MGVSKSEQIRGTGEGILRVQQFEVLTLDSSGIGGVMKFLVHRVAAVLVVAAALATARCGSAPPASPTSDSGRGPTHLRPPAAGDEGRVTALAVAPPLGTAGSYGVLGASTVTNTGPTIVNGDLGVSPGAAIVGFPPGVATGVTNAGNAAAALAQGDVTTAYNNLAGQACDIDLTGIDLGGLTLTPGTYCFSSSAQLTGTLTLNGLGNPGSVWVFQIGTTLTTASNSTVAFINGGQSCGAFWQIGTSATLGTGTSFSGNVLALASITLNTTAVSSGALFARTGAVTLDSNVVNVVGSCGSGPQPVPTPLGGIGAVPVLPEAAMGLLATLLAVMAFFLVRR